MLLPTVENASLRIINTNTLHPAKEGSGKVEEEERKEEVEVQPETQTATTTTCTSNDNSVLRKISFDSALDKVKTVEMSLLGTERFA